MNVTRYFDHILDAIGENGRGALWHHLVEADQRGLADRIEDVVKNIHLNTHSQVGRRSVAPRSQGRP